MAQAQAAANLQAALLGHDRVRRSTELPLFYGKKEKDVVTPHTLIARIERAAPIAGWNTDDRKCTEFYMTLRDRALIWWDSLDNCDNVNKDNWADVQREFLAAYAPRFTARTTCTNFQDLVQRQGENIHDYYLRVTESFKRMCDAKSATIYDVRAPNPDGMADTDEARAQKKNCKKEGLMDMERFFLHQLFIAGLKDELRSKIMEAGKPTLQESLSLARELEVIVQDKKKTILAAVVEEEDALGEEDIEAINAIRFQRGQKPFRRPGTNYQGQSYQKSASTGNTGSFQSNKKCRFCGGNHLQKVCRKRIAAGKPCVDQNGKPYTSQINAVDDQNQAKPTPAQQQTPGGLSSIGVNALNW